ncbi:MAG: hypothetical protein SGILL_003026, partial [Bacillariaceae sp.]
QQHSSTTTTSTSCIIKPVDMAPSKREGVRHAFTAEALRSVGGDEVERLQQLLKSGMPASIDIGGKDLYGWAVEMGALKCEELLRPTEAAKYGGEQEENGDILENGGASPATTTQQKKALQSQKSSFIVHRPTQETVLELNNRLDELESLSAALSSCLDNLAEEVSVCHGLLLMGGGATALASHVKSLKALKEQKFELLEQAQAECEELGKELTDLVHSSGEIGQEIAKTPAFKLFKTASLADGDFSEESEHGGSENDDGDDEIVRKSMMAQVAASESKIRKLRSSIADLSEENARDVQEVERRGLEGGINLVRGLREEIRDIDFHLGECRSAKAEYKTKISMICARVPKQEPQYSLQSIPKSPGKAVIHKQATSNKSSKKAETKTNIVTAKSGEKVASNDHALTIASATKATGDNNLPQSANNGVSPPSQHIDTNLLAATGNGVDVGGERQMTPSQKIATGDSTALAVIRPGNKGFFTVDLWQVILRIIGFDRAAYHRGIQVSGAQPNVMIV